MTCVFYSICFKPTKHRWQKNIWVLLYFDWKLCFFTNFSLIKPFLYKVSFWLPSYLKIPHSQQSALNIYWTTIIPLALDSDSGSQLASRAIYPHYRFTFMFWHKKNCPMSEVHIYIYIKFNLDSFTFYLWKK